MEVDIHEAAARLGVSESAVRRRLRTGTMEGRRKSTPSGFRWVCVLPNGAYATPSPNGDQAAGELVAFLKEQLVAKDWQIGTLLDQLREANGRLALPAPATGRPWWKIWKTAPGA